MVWRLSREALGWREESFWVSLRAVGEEPCLDFLDMGGFATEVAVAGAVTGTDAVAAGAGGVASRFALDMLLWVVVLLENFR